MAIFGASGDLTSRKLLPALYNLARGGLLPDEFAVLGFAKDEISEEEFRKRIRDDIRDFAGAPADCHFCDWVAERAYYIAGDFGNAADYVKIKDKIAELDARYKTPGNVFYYLATLPQFFSRIIAPAWRAATHLRRAGQAGGASSSRSRSAPIWNRRRRSTKKSGRFSKNSRSTGSIITWARRRFRISWFSAFRTGSSNRYGTGAISIMCRSRWRKTLGVERRGGYYDKRAASAT